MNESNSRNFLNLKKSDDKIYCPVRKSWLVNTPEEEVRQYMIRWLNKVKGYPIALMQVEKQVQAGSVDRFDLFIQARRKIILAEFKAPNVVINQSTLDQLIRYQPKVNADYFLISNGKETLFFYVNKLKRKIETLEHLPNYNNF